MTGEPMSSRRLYRVTWAALAALGSFSCAAGKPIDGSLNSPDYTALRLDPGSVTMETRDTLAFEVFAEFSDGQENPGVGASFQATGGTINSAGRFIAGNSPGSFAVIASLGGRSDTAVVTINSRSGLTGVRISPEVAAVLPGATQQFTATGVLGDGSDTAVALDWHTTGGTVTSGGLFTAPTIARDYYVSATTQDGAYSDSATVTVTSVPPNLTAVILTPTSATLQSGQTRQFSAVGRLSDGSTTVIPITWSANGGTVNSSGLYTAGNTAGNYRVIARAANGLADTSAITVSAPTVVGLTLTPATASLQTGQTRQFSVTAQLSNGNTQNNPSVTYTATGGSISAGGLYTAGGTAGTFRVIATAASGVADSSAVTISQGTVTGLTISPTDVSLLTGELVQFAVTAQLSSGGTQDNPAVTWGATGGTITTAGLYTAGTTTGTFRVTALLQGGTVADTVAVEIGLVKTGPFANRPASYTKLISDYGFGEAVPGNDRDQSFGTGGWSMIGGAPISIVSDPSAPVSPPSTLQWRFDPGPGGESVGNVYRALNLNVNEIYVAFSVWHDPNFEWNEVSNKLLYWEDGNTILQSRHNDSYLSLYIGAYDVVYDPNGYNPQKSDFNGKWVNIEYIVKRGNPGLLKVWMNGKLVSNYAVRVPTISSWSEVSINSTWGGGGTRTRTSYRRIDHVLIATP